MAFGRLGAMGRGFGGMGAGGSGGATIVPAGSRIVSIENSYGQHQDAGAVMFHIMQRLQGKLRTPVAGRLYRSGDRYEFATAANPGFIFNVPFAMAQRPQFVFVNNVVNNIAASQSLVTIQGHRQALLDAVLAEDGADTLYYIIEPTAFQWWSMSAAQRAILDDFNDWLLTQHLQPAAVGSSVKQIIVDLRTVGTNTYGYGGFRDGIHCTTVSQAQLSGRTIGNAILPFIGAGSRFTQHADPRQVNIQSISNASEAVIVCQSTHGAVEGEFCRITSATGLTSLNNTERLVKTVVSPTEIVLFSTDTTAAGAHTAGTGAISFGLHGGTTLAQDWVLTNATGATVVASKETIGGLEYQCYTVSGTATASTDITVAGTATAVDPPGRITGGYVQAIVGNGTLDGPPVGIEGLHFSSGQGLFGGTNPVFTITIASPTIGADIDLSFYNANVSPDNGNPVESDDAAYDAANMRIATFTYECASTDATTEATALATAINADAGLGAQGIECTSSGAVLTITPTVTAKHGLRIVRTNSGGVTVTIAVNNGGALQRIETEFVDLLARMTSVASLTGQGLSYRARPMIATNLDYKVCVRGPCCYDTEKVAYGPATSVIITVASLFPRPTLTLAGAVVTSQSGVFTGGGGTITYATYRNHLVNNPTPNADATIDNPDLNPTGWELVGDVAYTYTSSETGHYLINKVSFANSFGGSSSTYHWTSKTTGTVP